MRSEITLRKAMKMLDSNEPYTVGTEDGNGWLYYFDGNVFHKGVKDGFKVEDLLDRECVRVYIREGRKYWNDEERARKPYMELEPGLAFIVAGCENGII